LYPLLKDQLRFKGKRWKWRRAEVKEEGRREGEGVGKEEAGSTSMSDDKATVGYILSKRGFFRKNFHVPQVGV
jgi:hypothetical protein